MHIYYLGWLVSSGGLNLLRELVLFSQSNPERSRQTEHYVGHARQHALVAVGGTAEAKKGSMTGAHTGGHSTHTHDHGTVTCTVCIMSVFMYCMMT